MNKKDVIMIWMIETHKLGNKKEAEFYSQWKIEDLFIVKEETLFFCSKKRSFYFLSNTVTLTCAQNVTFKYGGPRVSRILVTCFYRRDKIKIRNLLRRKKRVPLLDESVGQLFDRTAQINRGAGVPLN